MGGIYLILGSIIFLLGSKLGYQAAGIIDKKNPKVTVLADQTEYNPNVSQSPAPSENPSPTYTPTPITTLTPTSTTTKVLPTPSLVNLPTQIPTPAEFQSSSPSPIVSPSPAYSPVKIDPADIHGFIERFSGQYGVDPNVLRHITNCESGYNNLAVNGLYGGLYQFSPNTWIKYRSEMGEDVNSDLRFNAEESVQTAAFILSTNRAYIWPNCVPKGE